MTRRRWIADEFSGDRAALTGTHAAHLSRTLRARVGQEFEVACGDHIRRATVSSVQDERVEFSLGDEVAARPAVPITLVLAIFKFDRMEWAIEKSAELNVATIVPVIARRTEKRLALAADKRVERWRRIAREAAEQSRRITPPQIGDPLKLKEALANYSHQGDGLRIVLAEGESELTLSEALRVHPNATSLALAVGPEGGWTKEELQLFTLSEWTTASLGETILRAETAAIAAVAVATAKV
jgi:16S rRNA (uracil1498-N3)-methyltransferase